MTSSTNKISIPKKIFENLFFKEGGTKEQLFKELTGEYQFSLDEEDSEEEPNAEIEGGEYIFDSRGVRKAEGNSHERGGMPVKLEEGTKIISDHLKVGAEAAKRIEKMLDLPIRPNDTYATVIDKYNKKSGLDEINDKLEEFMGIMKKQKDSVKDKNTSNLNLDFLNKKLYDLAQKKKPIEKEREQLFNVIFQIQEMTKKQEDEEEYEKANGGQIASLAAKYGISPQRAAELAGLPMYQSAGTYLRGDMNMDGVIDAKDTVDRFGNPLSSSPLGMDYSQLWDANKDIIVNSTNRTDFTNNPRTVRTLPYTPVGINKNSIWQEANYKKSWLPLVDATWKDEERVKKIDQWLTENKGSFAPNIQEQLKGLTGKARYDRIKELATDTKPGPFHDAVLQAMTAVKQQEEPEVTPEEAAVDSEVAPFTGGRREKVMGVLGLPQRPFSMPTLRPSTKIDTKISQIDPAYISPNQAISEIDRAASNIDFSGMTPQQEAFAKLQTLGNQTAAINKEITAANRYNAQAQNAADIYNAKARDTQDLYRGQNALSYEQRELTGLDNFDNDFQNMTNQGFRDQINNFKTVEMYNTQNAFNPNEQFTGNGYEVQYDPNFAYAQNEQAFLNSLYDTDKKKPTKSTRKSNQVAVGKFGGRFKKK